MNQLIKFLLAVILTLSLTETKRPKVSKCISPPEGRQGDYFVECSYDKGYRIAIFCHGKMLDNLTNIKINVDEVSEVSTHDCTLSQKMNVQNILYLMGINSSLTMAIDIFGNVINRSNLKNLSTAHLSLMGSNISEIPHNLFYDTLNLRSILIMETNITRIPKSFFGDWAQNLLGVNFYNNKLQKIFRDDFTGLINVQDISLAYNQINEIELGTFDNLPQLLVLRLTKNCLHTLSSGIFNQLANLKEFSFDSLIDFNYFGNKPKDSINLAIHQITNLSADALKGLYKVDVIRFAGHNLESLPLGLFEDHKNLVLLNIEYNGLKFLPTGIFKELKSLVELYMSKNRLTCFMPYLNSFYRDLFIGMSSLKIFNAAENNITQINAHFLNYSKKLEQIDLSYNQISTFDYEGESKLHYESTSLDTDIFEIPFFPQLELLNLRANKIIEFNLIIFLINRYFNGIGQENKNYGNIQPELTDQQKNKKIVDVGDNHISTVDLTELYSTMDKLQRLKVNNTKTDYVVYINLGNNPLRCDCYLMDFIRYLNRSSHQELNKNWMIFAQDRNRFGENFKCLSPPDLKNRDVRKVHLEEFYCLLRTNAFGDACIDTCLCQQYPEKHFLSVDCSFRSLTQLPKINNSVHNWSIELNMSGNALQRIPSLDHSYLANITVLDLSSNNITEVLPGVFSPKLQVLKLHNNSISRFDLETMQYLAHDNPLRVLTIHDNKWICDCETLNILQTSVRKTLSNYNFHEVLCHGTDRTIYEVTVSEVCEDAITVIISVSSSIAFFGFIVGSLAILYYKYQKQIKIWLYSRQLCLWFVTEDELDEDKKYDAFVSFSHKDEDFVERQIIAELESGPRPYKLCLHYRDWLAGEWIPWQISRSVADSRRTIIILTPSFLKSVWGLMEFRAAHTQALEEGRARLIVIVHGELDHLDDLDQELKDYLRSNTYIKWGDPWFWNKLKYALPHRSRNLPVSDSSVTVHYQVNR